MLCPLAADVAVCPRPEFVWADVRRHFPEVSGDEGYKVLGYIAVSYTRVF